MSLCVDFSEREGRVAIAETPLYANSMLRSAMLFENPMEGTLLFLKKNSEIPASSVIAALGSRGLERHNIRNNIGPDGTPQRDVLVVQNHSPEQIATALQQMDVYAQDKRVEGILCSPQLSDAIRKGFEGHAQERMAGVAPSL